MTFDTWTPEEPCIRHRAISVLLANDPRLLEFLFHPCRSRLARSAATLRRSAGAFSSGQQILVRIALDIWDDAGHVRLSDVVYRLDPVRFEAFLLALEVLRYSSSPEATPDDDLASGPREQSPARH